MAVFRIRKRNDGSFTVVGSLGDNRHFVAREVREVGDLDGAAEAVVEIATGFAERRESAKKRPS